MIQQSQYTPKARGNATTLSVRVNQEIFDQFLRRLAHERMEQAPTLRRLIYEFAAGYELSGPSADLGKRVNPWDEVRNP